MTPIVRRSDCKMCVRKGEASEFGSKLVDSREGGNPGVYTPALRPRLM